MKEILSKDCSYIFIFNTNLVLKILIDFDLLQSINFILAIDFLHIIDFLH